MDLVAAEFALEPAQPIELGAHLGDLGRREDVGDDEVAVLVEGATLLGRQRPDTQSGQSLGGVADHDRLPWLCYNARSAVRPLAYALRRTDTSVP